MKKLYISTFAALGIAMAPCAFSQGVDFNGYYSTQHVSKSATANNLVPPTDITVVNASSDIVYAIVPNSPIHDLIYSGQNDHIRHNNYYGDTHLVLTDPFSRTLFDGYVCRLAMVSVSNPFGAYRINVDSEYCY
ncbi:MAG: hypothetical protein A3E83_02310 [Gammaproteobacteria bacterium RIFCSPHIGHO2_12_FULL_41_20]|nr:MAG: hypothetical protein A3E83_02310 [Gammaproteobacteria bacterium RIFCSPHIGHO2_12_FULL_41_20]